MPCSLGTVEIGTHQWQCIGDERFSYKHIRIGYINNGTQNMKLLEILCGKLFFVCAVFIVGRQTIVIICRHQVGAATVKVVAELQHLFVTS